MRGADLPILLPVGIALFGLIVALVVSVGVYRERGLQKVAAARGQMALPRCPVCGGQTEPGIFQYRKNPFPYRIRSVSRSYPIGAVRCTQCGHVDLFAS